MTDGAPAGTLGLVKIAGPMVGRRVAGGERLVAGTVAAGAKLLPAMLVHR